MRVAQPRVRGLVVRRFRVVRLEGLYLGMRTGRSSGRTNRQASVRSLVRSMVPTWVCAREGPRVETIDMRDHLFGRSMASARARGRARTRTRRAPPSGMWDRARVFLFEPSKRVGSASKIGLVLAQEIAACRIEPKRMIVFVVRDAVLRTRQMVRAICGCTLEANRDQQVAICPRTSAAMITPPRNPDHSARVGRDQHGLRSAAHSRHLHGVSERVRADRRSPVRFRRRMPAADPSHARTAPSRHSVRRCRGVRRCQAIVANKAVDRCRYVPWQDVHDFHSRRERDWAFSGLVRTTSVSRGGGQ